jgi:chromosome segregation ATPase
VIRRELDLVRAALEERLESQVRSMLMLDQAVRREQGAAMSDAEKLSGMEAEVSGLRSLFGETAGSVQKAARDIDQVKAAAAEQRMAHGRDICALKEEMGRVGKAIEATGRSLGQQEGEWKAAIGELQEKAKHEQNRFSGLNKVLANLESKHEKLREIVATQGDELAETRRQNLELGGRLQQLEEENRLVRKLSAGLKDHLARVEAGQQIEVARLQETMAASGSKVKEDLSNVQGELGRMKEEIRGLKMTEKQFPPSVKKKRFKSVDRKWALMCPMGSLRT